MHTHPGGSSHGDQHPHIRTTCGRLISVGLLALGDIRHPAERIGLYIGPARGTGDGTWAGLTAGEARDLAAALLAQSAAAERAARNAPAAGAGSAVSYPPQARRTARRTR